MFVGSLTSCQPKAIPRYIITMIQVHDLPYFITEFTRLSSDNTIQNESVKSMALTMLPLCQMLHSAKVGEIPLTDQMRAAIAGMLDAFPQEVVFPDEMGDILPQFITWFRSL